MPDCLRPIPNSSGLAMKTKAFGWICMAMLADTATWGTFGALGGQASKLALYTN